MGTNRIHWLGVVGLALTVLLPAASAAADSPRTADSATTARIAFMTFLPRPPFQTTLNVVNPDGSGRRALTRTAWNIEAPAWSPDGRKLAFERRVSPLVNGQCGCNIDLFVMNADGSAQQNLTRNPVYDRHPVWSPDGQKLAFLRYRDVWGMNADGSEQRRLTPNRQGDDHPVWSPEGHQIAFTSFRGLNWDVWVMNADGTGHRNLTRNRAQDYYPTWSPDGSKIAFIRTRNSFRFHGHPWELWVMNADGSGKHRITLDAWQTQVPRWSPDGRKLLFVSRRDGNQEIYVVNADGSGQLPLTHTHPVDSPAWSPDGRKIAFTSARDGERAIYVMNADGSGQRNLTRGIRHIGGFAWSPGAGSALGTVRDPVFVDVKPFAHGKLTRTVDGVRFSLYVPTPWMNGPLERIGRKANQPVFRTHSLSIGKSTREGQAAEAVIFWAGFRGGGEARPCAKLIPSGADRSRADLAAAVASAPGTRLAGPPRQLKVGGRPATRVVLRVQKDLGCEPGYFFTWPHDPARFWWGDFWPGTGVGDSIRVWIVDVGGKRLFFEAATKPGHGVEQEIGNIVGSIRFH